MVGQSAMRSKGWYVRGLGDQKADISEGWNVRRLKGQSTGRYSKRADSSEG